MKLTRNVPTVLLFLFAWVWGFLWGAYLFAAWVDNSICSEFFKIKASDLMNSTVALLIALLVTHTLGKQSNKEQRVKELLVESITSLCTLSQQAFDLCNAIHTKRGHDAKDKAQIIRIFSQHSKLLTSLVRRTKGYGVNINFDEIIACFLQYKSFSTNDTVDIQLATRHYLQLLYLYENVKYDVLAC